ncbi:MAG: hypothetical protein JXM69_10200 [Anaerolineae bacterium]|nr:hypothetical protein [Anaerolineae bacterium]
MAKEGVWFRRLLFGLVWVVILLGLYLTSRYSYLLFHSLAELFSIIVACATFMLAWNSRRFLDNNYLLFIGIAFLFVAGLDLLHTLAYKGMAIFKGDNANLPTQLWIAARYLQSVSLLIAPLFLIVTLRPNRMFLSYTIVTSLLLGTIFYWQIFPDCYIEGVGLTPFKILSEYFIALILVGSIALLYRRRQYFDREVLRLLAWAIVCTISAELAFTNYVGVYDFSNLIGHILKIVSFYLIYKAIIETGLVRPYSVLFRNLKQSEETLRRYTQELQIRNEELDAYVHTVAHDLKTPLSNLTICSSMLLDDTSFRMNDDQREMLQDIKQTAFKMNSIIDELLLLAEVRQIEVKVEPLAMAVIVNEATKRLAHEIAAARAEIIIPNSWPIALGYAPWVEQVWVNYISNAIKYGGQPPRVELGSTIQTNGQIRFWIKDNGIGLSRETQPQLFTSFTQLGRVRVTGHGLGLSIVKRIVEKLNGQVGVESKGVSGHGSLFFFTLPRAT